METRGTPDVMDIRDLIDRFEALERVLDEASDDDDREEYARLGGFLEEVEGSGGDHKWRGDWYPVTFIRDSYFTEYAMELAEEIGAIEKETRWPYTCIDWERAAHELQMDYGSVEFDGTTYWYR